MTSTPPMPDDACARVAFAAATVGPAAAALVAREPTRLLGGLERGLDLTDAVLALVHSRMGDDRALANEFFQFFLRELPATGRRRARSPLAETLDLVQSLLGGILAGGQGLRFAGRAQYLSYLIRGLRWKAANRLRDYLHERRNAAQREQAERGLPISGPLDELVAKEEREHLLHAIERLPSRDREILLSFHAGVSIAEVARRNGLSYDAARMALHRAERRLASLT